jgi:hypothetical protein
MTAVSTDLMTWPPLLPFRQPMLARLPSRDFVVPFLVSVVIHAFLVFLFGVVDTDRTAFEPTAPSIDTHMIVSLTMFDTASQNELDREAVSVVPNTSPPAERSHSAERKAEAESIVASKGLGIPGLEVPDDKSLATYEIPLLDPEAISLIDWEFGGTSELEFETIVTSIDLGIPGLEVPDGNSLATDANPLIDPEAISRIALEGTWMHCIALEDTWMHCIEREGAWAPCIEREGTWMAKSEVLMQNYEYSMHIIKRNRALLPPDCRTAYANMGQLGIFFIIRDAITGNGCKW